MTTLSKTGPWFVYYTDNGIAAVNDNGTGRTLLTPPVWLTSDDLSATSVSPTGSWLAAHMNDDYHTGVGATIRLLHLPDGQLQEIAPVLSPELLKGIRDTQPAQRDSLEAHDAVVSNNTLRWSPNGRYLAFVAAIDGPSSDVYIYEPQTKTIRRLTDGPNQAANLSWSPDSKWIVHAEINFGIDTGTLGQAMAVWAAAADGSEVRQIYQAPTDSRNEFVLGWTGPNTFIAYTLAKDSYRNLRRVNLATGETHLIYADKFVSIALDSVSGSVVYALSEVAKLGRTAQEYLKSGLFLYSSVQDTTKLIEHGEWHGLTWSPEAQSFFTAGLTETLGVSISGTVKRFDEVQVPVVSPDGEWLAFCNADIYHGRQGLRLYTQAGDVVKTLSDGCSLAVWRPDSQGLFYSPGERSLSYISLADSQAKQVDKNLQFFHMTWIKP